MNCFRLSPAREVRFDFCGADVVQVIEALGCRIGRGRITTATRIENLLCEMTDLYCLTTVFHAEGSEQQRRRGDTAMDPKACARFAVD